MSALVTGATGFLGRHLVRHLVSEGRDVVAVVRPGREVPPELAGAELLATADARVIAERAGDGIGSVFHLATHYLRAHGPADIPELLAANVEFGTVLFDGLATSKAAIVSTLSFFQYRANQVAPLSLYAAMKEAFAVIAGYYRDERGLDVREVVLFDTYGPGDVRDKLVPLLVAAARSGEPVEIGPARQPLDLLHVDDVVRGLILAAEPGAHGRMALRAERPTDVGEVVATLAAVPGARLSVSHRDGVIATRPLDAGDWPAPPGWSPVVGLPEGLASAFAE